MSELIDRLRLYAASSETPETPALSFAADMRQAADRLASLEQQHDLMARQLQGSAYDTKDFLECIANLEAQVASLEQAQQVLRAQIQHVMETWREGSAYSNRTVLDARRACADALSTILTSQEKVAAPALVADTVLDPIAHVERLGGMRRL